MQKSIFSTPEFWASLVSQLVSMVVLSGGMTTDQGTEVTKAMQAICGGVMSLVSVGGLIWAQHSRRKTAATVISAQLYTAGDSVSTRPALTAPVTGIGDVTNARVADMNATANAFVKSI